MLKLLTLFLLTISWNVFADQSLSFEIRFGGQRGQVTLSDNGHVQVESPDFSPEFTRSIESSLLGVRVHNESTRTAYTRIIERVYITTGIKPYVRFSPEASLKNPFIRKQHKENLEFERNISRNIYRPTFISERLGKEISFDANDPSEREALKLYRESQKLRNEQLGTNEKLVAGNFAKSTIEIRQLNKDTAEQFQLKALTNLAKGFVTDNKELVVEAMTWLLRSQEFQKGFSTSIVNNFNPLSFLHPVEANCTTEWCKSGQYLGDAASIVIGAYEIMKGSIMTVGGGGITIALAGAAPGTGGISAIALPATAGATMAGIALAGHGLSTVGNAFSNLYEKIETPENLDALNDSKKIIEESGITKNPDKEVIKEFYDSLKDTKLPAEKKRKLLHSFEADNLKVEVLKQDITVYRWHNNDANAQTIGRFVSDKKIDDPDLARKLLALPSSNKMLHLDSYTLKAGTKIFKGKVAPLNGHSGGGDQIFIIGDIYDVLLKR